MAAKKKGKKAAAKKPVARKIPKEKLAKAFAVKKPMTKTEI